jgi:hypothetical protein
MVTLHRSATWKIAIYGRDHGVPHFHIEGREFRCSVSIVALEMIIGTAPAIALQKARSWASANQAILMAKWQELNG